MTANVSHSFFSPLAKWSAIALSGVGAVVLAKKAYNIFYSSTQLLSATNRYLHFINRVGKGESFPQQEDAASLLTSDCKKILNGKLFTSDRNAFVADLLNVQNTKGSWTVIPVDTIASPTNRVITLKVSISMNQVGDFTAMLILRFNSSYLITEIDEVLTKTEGAYGF